MLCIFCILCCVPWHTDYIFPMWKCLYCMRMYVYVCMSIVYCQQYNTTIQLVLILTVQLALTKTLPVKVFLHSLQFLNCNK